MSKKELIERVATEMGVSKSMAAQSLGVIESYLTERLVNDGRVAMFGFGNLVVKERAARSGVNPSTGEKITIPARRTVVLSVSKALKDVVNDGD